jgi:hypothetical protein
MEYMFALQNNDSFLESYFFYCDSLEAYVADDQRLRNLF